MTNRKEAAALVEIKETAVQNGKALDALSQVQTRLEMHQVNLEALIDIAQGRRQGRDFLSGKAGGNDNGQEGGGNG